MTLFPTIITADDLAARAQAEIETLPPTHLDTHVPHGADRIASRLHGRGDHFHLPSPAPVDVARSGSSPSRPAGASRHDPIRGAYSFTGFRHITTYRGIDRDHRIVPHFETGESPRPVAPTPHGGRRRETKVANLLAEATNLMGGAELDMRLARGATGAHREEILTRCRASFASAERCLHRAEALARAGRISPELRTRLSEARMRADTAEFGMRA